MDSTLIAPATPDTSCASAVVDALVRLTATAASAAPVDAVESWLSRETSAHGKAVLGSTPVLGSTADLSGTRGTGVPTGLAAHSRAGSATPASSVGSAAAYAAEPAMSFRNRNDVQGSPPRGTPV